MAKNGLPNMWAALFMMAEAGFAPSTVDKAAEQLHRATTKMENEQVLARQVEMLENGISEADFLKELEK